MSYTLVDSFSLTESSSNDSITYEKLSEDVYLIRTDHGPYELYRKELINTLQTLHQHAHVFISKLNHDDHELLKSTIEATRLLYNSKALKDLILQDIRSIYHDVKNPIPGTVGAFFVGCFNDDPFDGPIGCNPRCAASLFGCHEDQIECADTVLIFSHHQFTHLNKQKTPHCFIYVEDYKFTAFTPHQLVMLRKANHQEMTVIYSNEDGSYKQVSKRIPIDAVIDDDDNQGLWIGLIIIIAIVLLLLFFGLIYVYNDNTNVLYQYFF